MDVHLGTNQIWKDVGILSFLMLLFRYYMLL